jgi:hypothetical protein
MKFFKTMSAASSTEDVAAAERLRGIIDRGQAEVSFQHLSGPPFPLDGVMRRFWTPDELAPETASE